MTNEKLFEKIRQEIPHYQIGFHQISLYKYHEVINRDDSRVVEFKIDDEAITTDRIAQQIFNNGFRIWDRLVGLSSTSYFPERLSPDSFNYQYYRKERNTQICNLLLAVPYFLNDGKRKFFIGDLSISINVGQRLLFNDGIPPEFVYGYYVKDCTWDSSTFSNCFFSNELEFHENNHFWIHLNPEKQQELVRELFAKKREAYKSLRLANNHSQLQLLSYDRIGRFIIRETREQKKVYVKSLKD